MPEQITNEERTALFNDGKGREYPQTCPKCGAAKSYNYPLKFDCGSMPLIDRPGVLQTDFCRILELPNTEARLSLWCAKPTNQPMKEEDEKEQSHKVKP